MDHTDTIQDIRSASLDALIPLATTLLGDRLPREYFESLNEEDKLDAIQACLIVSTLTGGRVVPRRFQLEASLEMLHQRDCVIIAGTGSGKTLCLLIPLLLRPESISMTISPLKRLQATQVIESKRYGIKTIAINEDTPYDESLWKCIQDGEFQHLIVSPEQLGMFKGHLPRLARLLRENRSFMSKITRVHVDEAHNIHTAGLPHYGEDAFRPAYAKIGLLRILLSNNVPFQALSATLPDHVLTTVKTQLAISSNALEIRLSTNRPSITFATLPIRGTLRNFDNLRLLIPSTFHPPMAIPKTLVFHDSKQDAVDAAAFLNSQLPGPLRNHGAIKHYHSDMSQDYLQKTFEDFSLPDGTCRILHATAGAATGLDIPGVRIVIQYGICKNMAELAQRAGRAARDPNSTGLFLLMLEPFVLAFPSDKLNRTDPDEPFSGNLKKTSSKQDRTSVASIQYAQSTTCLREFFAGYLSDKSPQEFTGHWCCDRHPDTNFSLHLFFHGDPSPSPTSLVNSESDSKTSKRKRNQVRPVGERQALLDRLYHWRKQAHEDDPLCESSWIINNSNLELLSKTHISRITSSRDVATLLEETEQWRNEYGSKIFDIITKFQDSLDTQNGSDRPSSESNPRPSKRAKGTEFVFMAIQTPETFSAAM